MPLLEQFLRADYDNLAEYNVASIRLVCNYLGIKTEILLSSELNSDKSLKNSTVYLMNADFLAAMNTLMPLAVWNCMILKNSGRTVSNWLS